MFWAIFEFIGIVLPMILGAGWLALELIICHRLSRLEKLMSAKCPGPVWEDYANEP
jgi:hypothetical protein